MIPTDDEFLSVDAAVLVAIKHVKNLAELLLFQRVDFTAVIAEKCAAQRVELLFIQKTIPETKR